MSTSIPREEIKIIEWKEGDPPPRITRYEWTCPQCGTKVHGNSSKDTIFEIRHDAICVYCRVKNGTMRLNGSNFEHVKPATK